MPTVNIYVSERLQKRMEDFKGEGVNWSEIAQHAFEGKIRELSERKGVADMEALVDRLRQERGEAMDNDIRNGHAAGVAWAMQRAHLRELQAIEDCESEWRGRDAPDPARALADHMVEQQYGYQQFSNLADACYRRMFGDSPNRSSTYVESFVDGALDVWMKVKNEL